MGTSKKKPVTKAAHGHTIEMVEQAIEDISKKLQEEKGKGSYADLVRLIELDRELRAESEGEGIREIKVTWVEPPAEQSDSEK